MNYKPPLPRGERRTLREPAWVIDTKSGDVSYCVLHNVSIGGALMEMVDGEDVPDRFSLQLRSEEYLIECQVKWRTGNKVGLEFL